MRAGHGTALEPHSGWEAPPGTGGGKPREGFLRGGRAIPLPARTRAKHGRTFTEQLCLQFMKPKQVLLKMKSYTPFQQAVWRACMGIPKGQTRSYQWIASEIGKPGATRAVGSALGKNPFAPIVPCHRVIKSDGTIGGFSGLGGLAAKRCLLRKEKAPGF